MVDLWFQLWLFVGNFCRGSWGLLRLCPVLWVAGSPCFQGQILFSSQNYRWLSTDWPPHSSNPGTGVTGKTCSLWNLFIFAVLVSFGLSPWVCLWETLFCQNCLCPGCGVLGEKRFLKKKSSFIKTISCLSIKVHVTTLHAVMHECLSVHPVGGATTSSDHLITHTTTQTKFCYYDNAAHHRGEGQLF